MIAEEFANVKVGDTLIITKKNREVKVEYLYLDRIVCFYKEHWHEISFEELEFPKEKKICGQMKN